jgi:NADP-dependent 3-hydroxy acid dehydrogenase YdfG
MKTSQLTGAVAVISGASSGIGWATALALSAQGATVVLLARRIERLKELADVIDADGGQASAYEVDVTDASCVEQVIRAVGEGHGRIDVLVNNAGFLANGPALGADLSDWHQMIDINVGGVLNLTHAALPYVVSAAKGSRGVADIVNVSSVAGRRVPAPSSNVYAASKHAVVAFSEALRQELSSEQVRVGLIEPGVVRTEMTTGGAKNAPDATTGLPLNPEDVAGAITFMVTQPPHAAVNEILLRPTEQVT